jgi:hypothetical protein
MNRTALLTITLLSSLATPFVVQAMTPPREAAPRPSAQPAIVKAVAAEPAKAAEPSCPRKVKVVYSGYGEGAGRACGGETAAK